MKHKKWDLPKRDSQWYTSRVNSEKKQDRHDTQGVQTPAIITVSYLYRTQNDMVTVIVTHGDSSVVIVSVVIRDLAWGALKDISTNHIIGPYWHLQMYVWLHVRQHIALDTLALHVMYHIMTMTMQPQQQTVTPPSHLPIEWSVNKHISNRLEYST